MGWFSNTVEGIKAATTHDPVECPRGWGPVSFVGSAWVIPPMFGVSRECPIGGVTRCGECKYPTNPEVFRLAEQLAELRRLRDEGELSPAEYGMRRQALVYLHADTRGRAFYAAGWIMCPLGALIAVIGIALALRYAPGLWAIAILGAVVLCLGMSFFALARSARPSGDGESGR